MNAEQALLDVRNSLKRQIKLAHVFSMKQDDFYHEVVAELAKQGVGVLAWDNYTANADFTVVLGGDGTVLAAGRKCLTNPLLVINTGHLGFLTSTSKENYQEVIEAFLHGSYTLTKRRTLRVRIAQTSNKPPITLSAINDVVIAKNQLSKLVNVAVYLMDNEDLNSKELVSKYRADGLIVSTPTGSTAYNLSAGGPILHPSCEAFIVTPICPQGLTQRAMVIPAHITKSSTTLRIEPMDSSLYVSVDGQIECPMRGNVDVSYNSHCLDIVNPTDTYFSILRKKLGWGVKPV